jgi:hypothetical protein
LAVTTASTSAASYNIVLNGATAVNVTATTNGSLTTTAQQIAAGTYTGWTAVQNATSVIFTSTTAGSKTGSYSLAQSGAGTPAVGTFTTINSGASRYKLWQQEFGTDEVDGIQTLAVQSYFETNAIWPAEMQGSSNKGLYVDYFEPDFVQSGDMTVQVTGSYSNARAPQASSDPITFPATATSADEQVVYIREQRRQMRFRFESNVVGGNYEMGDTMSQVRPADGRITS